METLNRMGARTRYADALPVPPDQVKEQLARILLSAPFRHSRRCQALLSYVVEAACEGRVDELKERVVGAAVFGREADYDTNQDAVVRNAAAEIRKRLAQYYLDATRENEIRIDLPSGSYVPEFRLPREWPPVAPTPAPMALGDGFPKRPLWVSLAASTVIICAAAWLARPARTEKSISELERFWAPLTSAQGAVQLCIGQSRFYYYAGAPRGQTLDPKVNVPAANLAPMRDRFVWFGDAICMSRLSGYLTAHGKETRFRGALITPYSELRGNPVVLIGAFNNEWTIRLTEGLRFRLAANDERTSAGVRDKLNPQALAWTVRRERLWADTEEDFAIVTRVFDPDMERWVLAAGGITHYGTMMAGDFLSNPAYFKEAVRSAPSGWDHKNMQIVLQTKVVGGTPGPPRVVATHTW